MSAGCNYYITAQDVAHAHAIDTARLLSECVDLDFNYRETVHICDLCDKQLTDAELILLDDLPDKTCELTVDDKMSLFYIGGYVARKQTDQTEEHCLSGQPEDLSPDIQAFTASLNRGGLISPSTNFFILLLHIFLFFKNTTEVSCRKRFVTIFSDFPSLFHLNMTISKAALRRIVNILMKRFASLSKDNHNTEQKRRKMAKLSSL